MIIEQGTVTAIEGPNVWVKTIKQSACGRCSARAGCGQSLLNRFAGGTTDIPAKPTQHFADPLLPGDEVELGIAEGAVLTASLFTYGLPIVFLVLAVALAEAWLPAWAPLFAVAGLTGGYFSVRAFLRAFYSPQYFEPVILRKIGSSEVVIKEPLKG